ncbi:amino acid ABC transporter substrate-binding protein [Burkholderia sp. WAC0059]|uniref:glutamate/aspartate ABC transporter substrate-binding protein n=1 Tax=Burkholderia sp. WAC0059 TaxID=2066022 RepID=UPI000C7EB338|nr:glutamate/aspartate ABC transporter substrate-binding protein [Burkholderia sp. WAC0059]PLZ03328.1 amino acid ABC transporter substrate-binding protein [Burkholderia sp. WAC0059]
MRVGRALLAWAVFCAAAAGAQGQESDTLARIRETGVIALGYREASIPFSYDDGKGGVIGYSQDFAAQIVEAVKRRLNAPDLKVALTPVTPENRMSLVQNGTVDLECGSTTHDAERAEDVAFSYSIFVIGTRLMTRRGAGIRDWRDLRGKTVVTTAGTTSERLLRGMNETQDMHMRIISAKDHDTAFLALSTGRAVAFMMDDALLAGERARSGRPGDFVIVGKPRSREAYGCMMRKDDPGFRQVVNDAIAKVETSGEAERIYRKWFLSPIPPNGLNLNFPESDDVKALYRNPNDRVIAPLSDWMD